MADTPTPSSPSPAQAAKPGRPFAFLGKLPLPAKLALGGGVLGLGYALVRDRGKKAQDATVDDATAEDSSAGTAGDQFDPYSEDFTPTAPVGYVGGATPVDSGETVGAVGQTALETALSSLTGITTALLENRQFVTPVVNPAAIHSPPPGAPRPPGSPAAAKPPAAATCKQVHLAPAYKRSSTAYGKHFPHACGWARIGSGGKGGAHYIDIHVRYVHLLQRWRYWPNKRPRVWRKTWEGRK